MPVARAASEKGHWRGNAPSRLLLAAAIAAAFVAQLALLPIATEARANRAHVEVEFAAENAIVQVFVECRVAYVFDAEGPREEHVDLGWLKNEALLTFQTRGRTAPGYLALSYRDGSRVVPVVSGDAEADEAALPADRLAPAESWTVSGRQRFRAKTCQRDREHFDSASAYAPDWREGAAMSLGVVIAAANTVPLALAIFGLVWLVAAACLGQFRREQTDRRTAASTLIVLPQAALLLLAKLAPNDFPLAVALCTVIGAALLLAVVFWLLRPQIHRWTAIK
jgi:hypothetical protein